MICCPGTSNELVEQTRLNANSSQYPTINYLMLLEISLSIHTPYVEDLEIVETEYVHYLFSNQSSVEMASNFFPKKPPILAQKIKLFGMWSLQQKKKFFKVSRYFLHFLSFVRKFVSKFEFGKYIKA